MAFSPDYVRLVLAENFRDARMMWLGPLMSLHRAHLVMLAEQGIITRDVARAIRDALQTLDVRALAQAPYDPIDEDLFFRVDRLLAEACGPAVAGQLHTARSRNDIDMTMYRLKLREYVRAIGEHVVRLRDRLIALASDHVQSIFPALTHTQPAQPTTLAHYLAAVIEQLERDSTRILAAHRTVNECPLGACAITGTGFSIDRARTSRLLGFVRPTRNTYGSIATADFVLESAAAVSVLLIGLGRVTQDFLLWATVEVGYLRLDDNLVQISSIMPQKRNPVALEHTRVLASRAVAELGAIGQTIHNTPFGDVVDTEDDLQPLVASAFHLASRSVELLTVALDGSSFDIGRMRERAGQSWVVATEVADTLTRDYGVPFGVAHAITSELVRQSDGLGATGSLGNSLRTIARAHGHTITASDDEVLRLVSPEHFIEVRHADGEPAPVAMAAALARSRGRLNEDRAAFEALRAHEAEAAAELEEVFARL